MVKAELSDLELELWLRRRESGDIAWETKDGKLIKLKDMETSHIINALRYFSKYEDLEGLTMDDIC